MSNTFLRTFTEHGIVKADDSNALVCTRNPKVNHFRSCRLQFIVLDKVPLTQESVDGIV